MSLQFVIGRAGSGKTTYCIEQIKEKLVENPQGAPIIFVVPDQMSFQMEVMLATHPELKGMIRAQVYSLSRLAYRILNEVGGMSRIHLDQVGITMILRRILEKRKDELKIYKRSAEQQGFYEQLELMIAEFKRYCVAPQDLLRDMEMDTTQMLMDKIHDLHLIYQDFELAIMHKYMDSEDFLGLFVEKIPHSDYLRHAEIYVDGFYQYTPQELLVLGALFNQSKKVTMTLTLDQTYDHNLPDVLDLFYTTAITYQQVKDLAQKASVHMEQPIQLEEVPVRFKDRPSLVHVEQQFDQRPVQAFEGELDVHLLAAVNRRAEIEGLARTIIQLVRDQGYRWRDIAILTRNMALYQDLIETVFKDYNIPVFIDQKRPMLHHPLIELLRSVLDVINQNWHYEAVFRCVKTDLLFPWNEIEEIHRWRERYDLLENFVLANGINGSKWIQDDPWKVYQHYSLDDDWQDTNRDFEAEQEIEELRQTIVKPIVRLQHALREAQSVRAMCEEIFLFVEELHVFEKLEKWSQQAEQNGKLQDAREHNQVRDAFLHVLDQLVEIMGDSSVPLDLLAKMVETGCDHLRFSLVPPALDQVVTGNIELSRFSNVKHAFILGMNDGIIPARLKEEGLITEEERELLQNKGVALAPGHRIQLAEEYFYLYVAMCSASDGLHLSYALADEEGKSLSPSTVLQRIKQMYPMLKEELCVLDPQELQNDDEKQWSFVVQPNKTLTYLATQLRQWKKGYSIPGFWWDVYNWFVKQPEWHELVDARLNSLFYQNVALPLSTDMSRMLYGERIQTSVSRMELFQACPFSHFLSYGLKLKERRIYRLEAPDIGQLFHAALKFIDDELRRKRLSWRELSLSDCQLLAQQAVDRIAPRMQGNILFSNHRHHYLKYKLQQVVERATSILYQHSKASQFVPVGMEIGFGPGGSLPALNIPLANGVSMDVIGRIDRVDQARGSKGLFLRVIDFKSSRKDLQLAEVYHGLSLQMLTYLDVLLTHSKRWLGEEALPAGVLYFHIHNPMLNKKSIPAQDKLEQELYRQFKMRGLVVADEEVVQLMDTTLESQHSEIIPVGIKKDGGFYSQSKVASQEEFTHLRKYVRQQMKDIGTNLTNGKIDITPYKMKQKMACTFCPYQSVCHYDQTLEENNYMNLPVKSSTNVLDEIRSKLT